MKPMQRWVFSVVTLLMVIALSVRFAGPQTTERVSVASDGTQSNRGTPEFIFVGSFNPGLSADGRFVAFQSTATNLVAGDTNDRFDVFVHDRETGTTERVSVASDGTQGNSV